MSLPFGPMNYGPDLREAICIIAERCNKSIAEVHKWLVDSNQLEYVAENCDLIVEGYKKQQAKALEEVCEKLILGGD